jgi:hypothetical protein
VTNVIGAIEGDGSKLFRAFYCTYRSAFPTVVIHPVFGGTEYQNLMVVATVSAAPSKAFLQEQWERLRARHPSAPNLTDAVAQRVRRADPDSRRPDPDRRLRTRRRAARGLTAAATRGSQHEPYSCRLLTAADDMAVMSSSCAGWFSRRSASAAGRESRQP